MRLTEQPGSTPKSPASPADGGAPSARSRGPYDHIIATCLVIIAVGMVLGPVAAMSGNPLILDAAAALAVVGFFGALFMVMRAYNRSK